MDLVKNKVIFVDIDGIICTDNEGDYEKAEPFQRNIDIINELYKHNTIILWTARGSYTGKNWKELTKKQLKLWGVKYHELRMDKPYYDLFIDDKSRRGFYEL